MFEEEIDPELQIGLEIRKVWCDLVFSGRKKIETRRYPLPVSLLHRKIWVLQTEEGLPGTSSLPDTVSQGDTTAELVGFITFRSSIQYRNKEQWDLDRPLHCVDATSPYNWDGDGEVFGWSIEDATRFNHKQQIPGMTRLHRSLFVFNHA